MIDAKQLSLAVKCSQDKAVSVLPYLLEAMNKYQINTPLRICHFLAQVGHESMGFLYTKEIASGSAYDNRKDLGNTLPEAIQIAKAHLSTPGKFWKGHGYIQITGYNNHKLMGELMCLDLVNDPEKLCTPKYAILSAAIFWYKHNLNQIADTDDIVKITKIINGGTNGLDDRVSRLANAKSIIK